MLIDKDILLTWGGLIKKYKKGEVVFREGDYARYYYQIMEGKVKMYNVSPSGKEFIQSEFMKGCSFGEPPLFIDELYPSGAVTTEPSVIIRLAKDKLFEILNDYPLYKDELIKLLAKRIYNKATTARDIINNDPEARILGFLNHLKRNKTDQESGMIEVPYTRQEIANYTGLRVETVIRTLSKMKKNGVVNIEQHKLFY